VKPEEVAVSSGRLPYLDSLRYHRVGLQTCRSVGRSFDQQRAWINRIYDLRSKYVHEGVKLSDQGAIEEMYALCQHVFRCLLRLQAANFEAGKRGKETLAQWRTLFDFLSRGLIAGQNFGMRLSCE
jgi:hypothetical protein